MTVSNNLVGITILLKINFASVIFFKIGKLGIFVQSYKYFNFFRIK